MAKIEKKGIRKKGRYSIAGKRVRRQSLVHVDKKGDEIGVLGKDEPVYAKAILITHSGKPENQMTSFEKMELVEEGISKKDLENLKESAGLDYDKLAKILSVARATLINKKGKAKFNSSLSEKIVALADVYAYGYEVFEDKEKFNQWIFRPNTALGGRRPFDLLDNSFGREEIKHLIGRIDYGVYS